MFQPTFANPRPQKRTLTKVAYGISDGFLERRGYRYQLTERDLAIVEEARDVLFPKLAEDGISVLIVFFSPGDFGP